MNDKEVLTEAEERRRRQSSLLSTFEEIAQTSLSSVSGERGNGKVFTSLQDYLDGSVLINGAYCSRRTVLLAIHDMKDKQEAPSALQSKTLSKLELLHLRPVPQVIFYDDIATAIHGGRNQARGHALVEAPKQPTTIAPYVSAMAGPLGCPQVAPACWSPK